ncbi:isoprenylcysteine carboxylmethyltransferase family protein [Ideonella sp. A 288]|uniref:methyltransferase family protein n=1 Tax=Ideonella sp. A 288 TaxID=1962181 RepID=UPI001F30F2C3|nr:methyltransferase [Ideonella sp. A 288]
MASDPGPQEPQHPAPNEGLGRTLVVLQFALIGGLALLAAPAILGGRAPSGAWWLAAAGAAVGAWALAANRPGNFNIRPTPRAGGQLVDQGPYRWIRHPMYTSVGALAAACVGAAPSAWSAGAALALAAVLGTKALLEERWMAAAHPGYAGYRARTRRFLPGLF